MCDPASLAVASTAATVIGTGASAFGAIQQGKAAKAAANYQAQVARNNAILTQRAADDARKRGEIAESQQRDATKKLIGRQRAALAGAGVEVDTGSALDITSETAEAGELDALTIRSNAEREALGYEAQGSNYNAAANLAQFQGQNAASAATSQAFGTILGGIGSVAQKWYGFRRETSGSGFQGVGGNPY